MAPAGGSDIPSTVDAQTRSLPLKTATGPIVPLGDVAEVITERGPVVIEREKQSRRAPVEFDVRGRDLVSVVAPVRMGRPVRELRERAAPSDHRRAGGRRAHPVRAVAGVPRGPPGGAHPLEFIALFGVAVLNGLVLLVLPAVYQILAGRPGATRRTA